MRRTARRLRRGAGQRELLTGGVTPTVERAGRARRRLAHDGLPVLPQPAVAARGDLPGCSALRLAARRPPAERRPAGAPGDRDPRRSAPGCSTARPSCARCSGCRSDPSEAAPSCRSAPAARSRWIEDALAPLRDTPARTSESAPPRARPSAPRSASSPSSGSPTSPGYSRDDAVELMRHSARTLLRAAL